jgi:hypothetical protein
MASAALMSLVPSANELSTFTALSSPQAANAVKSSREGCSTDTDPVDSVSVLGDKNAPGDGIAIMASESESSPIFLHRRQKYYVTRQTSTQSEEGLKVYQHCRV